MEDNDNYQLSVMSCDGMYASDAMKAVVLPPLVAL